MPENLTKITSLLGNLEEDEFIEAVRQTLSGGEDPLAVVEACRDGMGIVGERFDAQEYFVNELIYSAELFTNAMTLISPLLEAVGDEGEKTKVVFGTVKDDIHDIGKDIVIAMLRCSGFEVYDLGIDVPADKFVETVKETGAKIVGLSGLLTIAFMNMEKTIKALKDAGLDVKTMVGGGMTNEMVCESVGADGWGKTAVDAVNLVKSFAEEM